MSGVFDTSSTQRRHQHQQKEDGEEAAADHPNPIEQQPKVRKLLVSSPPATNNSKFASQYSPDPSGGQEESQNSLNNHKTNNADGDFALSKTKTLLNKLAGGSKVELPKISCIFEEETTDEDSQFAKHDGTNGEEKNDKHSHSKESSHPHQLANNNLSKLNRTNNKTIFDSSSSHPIGTILNNSGEPGSSKSNPNSINPQTTQHFVVHSSSIGSPAAVESSNPFQNHNNNKPLNGPTSSRNPTNNYRSPPHSPPPHSHHHSRLFPPTNNFHHNLLNNHQNHHFPLLYDSRRHLAAARTISPPTIGNEQKGFTSPPFPPTSSLICTSPPPPTRPQIHRTNCINRQSPVAKPAPAAAFAVPTLPARPRPGPSSAHQQKERRNHLEEAEGHSKKEEKVEQNQKEEQKTETRKEEVEKESESRKSPIVAEQVKKEKQEIVEEEAAEESAKVAANSFSTQQSEEGKEKKEEEALEESIERKKSIEKPEEEKEEKEEPVPSTSAAALQIQQEEEKQEESKEESSAQKAVIEPESRQKSPVKHIRLVLRVSATAAFQLRRLAQHHSGKALRRIGIGSIQVEEEHSKLLKRTRTLPSTSSFTESIEANRPRQRRTIPVPSRSPSPGESANRRARIQQIRQQQQILLQRSQQQLAAALIQHQQRGTPITTSAAGGNKTPQSAGKVNPTNNQNPLLPPARPLQQSPAIQQTRSTPAIFAGGFPHPNSAHPSAGPTHPTTPHLSQPAPSVYPQSTHIQSQQMDQPAPSNISVVGQHPPQMIGPGQMASMPNQAMGGGKGAAENNSPLLVNLLSNNNVPQNAVRTQQPQQSGGAGIHPSNSQQQAAIMNAQQQQQQMAAIQQQQQRGYVGQQQQGQTIPQGMLQAMPQGISTQQMAQGMQQMPQGMNAQQQQMYHQQQMAHHQQMMSMQYAVGGPMAQTPQNAVGHYMVMGPGGPRMRPAGGMPPQQMMGGGPPVMPTGMATSYYMGMPPTMTPLHPHQMMAGTAGQMIGPGEMKPTAVQQAEEPPKKRKRISKKQQQKEERERTEQQQQIRAQEQQMVQQQQMRMVYMAQQQQRMAAIGGHPQQQGMPQMGTGGGGNGPSPSQQAFGSQMTQQQHYQQQMAQYHLQQQQQQYAAAQAAAQQQRQSVAQGHPGFQSPLPGSMIGPGYAQTTPPTPGPGPSPIGASPQQQTQQFMGGPQGPYSMMMSPQQQQMWNSGMNAGPSSTGTPVPGQNMSADFHLHQMNAASGQQQMQPQTPQSHPASVPSFRAPDTPYFGQSPAGAAPTPFQSPPPSSSQQMVGTPGGHQTPTGGHLTPGGSAGTGGAHTPIDPTNGGSGPSSVHQVHTPQPSSATSFGPQIRPQMNSTEFYQASQQQQQRIMGQQQNCPPPSQSSSMGTQNQQQEGGNGHQSSSTFPQLMDFAEGGLGDGPELGLGGIANEGIDDLDQIEPMRCGEHQLQDHGGHHHHQQQIHSHQQQHNVQSGGQQMHPGMMPHGYFVPGGAHSHPMMQMQHQSGQIGDGQQQYQPQNAQQFHQQHRSPQMIGAMQQQSAQIMNQNQQGGHHQNPQIDQKAGLIKLMQQQIKEEKASKSAGTSSSGDMSVEQRQMMAADMAMLPDRSPQSGETPSPSNLSESQDKNVSDAIDTVLAKMANPKTGPNVGAAKGGATGADGGKSTPGKSRVGPTKRSSQSSAGSTTAPIINHQPQLACSSSAGSLSQHSSSISRTPTPQTPNSTSISSFAEQQFKQRIGPTTGNGGRQTQFTCGMPQTTAGGSSFEMMRKSMGAVSSSTSIGSSLSDQPSHHLHYPPHGQIVQQAQADSSTSTSTTPTTAGSMGQFAQFNGGAHFHIPFGHPHQQNTPSSSTSPPAERKTPLSAPAGKVNEPPRFDTGTFMNWATSNNSGDTMSRGRTSSGGGIKDGPIKGDGGEKKPRKRKAKQENDGQEGGGKKQRRGSKAGGPSPAVIFKSFPIADGNGVGGQMVVPEIAQAESNSSMAPATSTTSSSTIDNNSGRMMISTEGRPPS